MGIDPFYPDWFHWQMGWALYEKNDCRAALTEMQKMSKIDTGAHRMLAGIYACLGNAPAAKEALAVFLKRLSRRIHQQRTQKVGEDMDRPRKHRPLDRTHADRGVTRVTAVRARPSRSPTGTVRLWPLGLERLNDHSWHFSDVPRSWALDRY